MFRCSRCSTELNPITSVGVCPICLSRQGIRAPLPFDPRNPSGWRDPADRRFALQASAAKRQLPDDWRAPRPAV